MSETKWPPLEPAPTFLPEKPTLKSTLADDLARLHASVHEELEHGDSLTFSSRKALREVLRLLEHAVLWARAWRDGSLL